MAQTHTHTDPCRRNLLAPFGFCGVFLLVPFALPPIHRELDRGSLQESWSLSLRPKAPRFMGLKAKPADSPHGSRGVRVRWGARQTSLATSTPVRHTLERTARRQGSEAVLGVVKGCRLLDFLGFVAVFFCCFALKEATRKTTTCFEEDYSLLVLGGGPKLMVHAEVTGHRELKVSRLRVDKNESHRLKETRQRETPA